MPQRVPKITLLSQQAGGKHLFCLLLFLPFIFISFSLSIISPSAFKQEEQEGAAAPLFEPCCSRSPVSLCPTVPSLLHRHSHGDASHKAMLEEMIPPLALPPGQSISSGEPKGQLWVTRVHEHPVTPERAGSGAGRTGMRSWRCWVKLQDHQVLQPSVEWGHICHHGTWSLSRGGRRSCPVPPAAAGAMPHPEIPVAPNPGHLMAKAASLQCSLVPRTPQS